MKSLSLEPTSSVSSGGGSGGRHHQQQQQQQGNHHTRQPSQPQTHNGNVAVTELNHFQVERLRAVLSDPVEIHGRENFPTLEIQLYRLIAHVKRKLHEAGLQLNNVKMNGGAASYVLATADDFAYSDLDLIFPISLTDEYSFDRVRSAVFAALLELMPDTANKEMICADTLKDVYIRKMVKVSDGDHWSLFSLHNNYGRCIELKFVDKMRRQFEFSVDSFQITLDPLLDILSAGQKVGPSVVIKAESKYGDVIQALAHLNKRLIDTRNPEEIRGGGLLKYCHLMSRGYHPTSNCRSMERYMCSRFFIDFPDINVQENKLRSYLDNHFGNEDQLKLDYLQMLYRVIRESTVCLMGHERRLTLHMVDRLRQILSFNLFYGGCGDPQQFSQPYYHPQMVHYQQQQQGVQSRKQAQSAQPLPVVHQYHRSQQQFDSASVSAGSSMSSDVESGAPSTSGSEAVSTTNSQSSSGSSTHVPRQTLLYLPRNATRWIPVM